MAAHHHRTRPRYGRVAAAVSSMSVTVVAVMAGVGVLPSAAEEPGRAGALRTASAPLHGPAEGTTPGRSAVGSGVSAAGARDRITPADLLPADSGSGRRAVYSEGQQRVWIVGARDKVLRTYPVSGSIYDNLDPGTFEVYSRSLHAIGIDDSGTMRYFVRFTQGDSGAAIGFHDIPVDGGEPLQAVAELGTPTSHGCIRQKRADAKAMWEFARIGTTVVVTA